MFAIRYKGAEEKGGGALNGFRSETIFAHLRYKGSLFPYTPYQAPSLSPLNILNTLRNIRDFLFSIYSVTNRYRIKLS